MTRPALVAAGVLIAVAIAALPVSRLTAQTLSISSNTLSGTAPSPVVTDFTANSNAGQAVQAGKITFTVNGCPANKTCLVKLIATQAAASAISPVTWTSAATQQGNFKCDVGSSQQLAVSTAGVTILTCPNSKNSAQDSSTNTITFTYTVSWTNTTSTAGGTAYTLGTGLKLTVTVQ